MKTKRLSRNNQRVFGELNVHDKFNFGGKRYVKIQLVATQCLGNRNAFCYDNNGLALIYNTAEVTIDIPDLDNARKFHKIDVHTKFTLSREDTNPDVFTKILTVNDKVAGYKNAFNHNCDRLEYMAQDVMVYIIPDSDIKIEYKL